MPDDTYRMVDPYFFYEKMDQGGQVGDRQWPGLLERRGQISVCQITTETKSSYASLIQ